MVHQSAHLRNRPVGSRELVHLLVVHPAVAVGDNGGGASVAAAWLWRGTLGLLLHAATTMAIFMTTLWLISLCWDWARFAAHFNAGWLADSLALVTVLGLAGTTTLIRRASIRGS